MNEPPSNFNLYWCPVTGLHWFVAGQSTRVNIVHKTREVIGIYPYPLEKEYNERCLGDDVFRVLKIQNGSWRRRFASATPSNRPRANSGVGRRPVPRYNFIKPWVAGEFDSEIRQLHPRALELFEDFLVARAKQAGSRPGPRRGKGRAKRQRSARKATKR